MSHVRSLIPRPSHSRSPAKITREYIFIQQKPERLVDFMMSDRRGLDFRDMKCLMPMHTSTD